MRIDPLKQFAQLRQKLTEEKSKLEARLREINSVLGSAPAPAASAAATRSLSPTRARATGRGRNKLSMREAVLQALSKGPLARHELVAAVEAVGYKFGTNKPLNSIGALLYGKKSPVKNKDGKFYVPEGSQSAASAAADQSLDVGTQPVARKKRRTMTPEVKAKLSAAAKARWARQKKGK